VVEGARKSKHLSEIIVATDDQRISELCNQIGVKVVMTPSDCPTGTDRIFAATRDLQFDVVLNIQGDEPLIDQSYIDPLAGAFLQQPGLDMATLAHPLAAADIENKNAVKVIINERSEAIYFSRFAIPFSREPFDEKAPVQAAFKHIGLYGFSQPFLQRFCSTKQTLLEKHESLEQLRALYLGARIKVLKVEKPTYGVDTPEDLQKLEALLK
jgi:3-deoxy-manno-octulosonate cytidylyltransferase (CMP-KDO synthetase)